MQRPETGSIPTGPGSYQFKDAPGPGALRRQGEEPARRPVQLLRLRRTRSFRPRRQWSGPAKTVEWIEVTDEVEALFLDHDLVEEHRPRVRRSG